MFDRVEIVVNGGNGGDGAVNFRREKFVPFGGPDGGDGGKGGDVVIMSDPAISSLKRFKTNRLYKSGDGGNGTGKRKHGKNGVDLILKVPPGTVVAYKTQIGDNALITDLEKEGQTVVVADGGKGGFGNCHFVSSTNQAPQIAQKGEEGEEKSIILELRLIADVGVIGHPNVGKSSLLAAASAAKPRIASYPFTTTEPVLGVVEVGQRSFILAEIPGLIEDAHLGRGLGHDFLRHAMRTKILIHLLDGTAANPVEDMAQVNAELSLFDSALAGKPQLVSVNKIDLPEVRSRVDELKDAFSNAGIQIHFVSAATGEGVSQLMAEAMKMVESINRLTQEVAEKLPEKVFRPQPRRFAITVRKEGETYVVVAPELERIVARADLTNPEAVWQLRRELIRLGVGQALSKAKVKPGGKVRLGALEWEW